MAFLGLGYLSSLPWTLQWRMIAFQPIKFITYLVTKLPWVFRKKPWTKEDLQLPGRTLKLAVFKAPMTNVNNDNRIRPLVLNVHGGAFLGGSADMDWEFCKKLSVETGAVVVSTTYRYAPRHVFPAAIDDIDAVVEYLHKNAREKYGADPNLMTVTGFSAGGNLVLAATQQKSCHNPASTAFKASVTFYAVTDLRPRPREKPRPEGFPAIDPLSWMEPLFNSYAGPKNAENMQNPRMNPILASVDTLPENMLFLIPTLDILLHEQLTFVERLTNEITRNQKFSNRTIKAKLFEK
jgi:acetyl esterase/lipase